MQMNKDKFSAIFFISFMFVVLFVGVVYALDECGTSIPEDTTCSLVSPYISNCNNFNISIYFSNGTSAGGGPISQIGSTGIYNFTATFNVSDVYVIKLCDDSVRSLTVINTSAISPSGSFWSYLLQIYYNTLPGAW